MKILDAIAVLHDISVQFGDLELVGVVEVDGRFVIDYGRVFKVMGQESEDEKPDEIFCAFIEETMDDPSPGKKRTLSLVSGGGPAAA